MNSKECLERIKRTYNSLLAMTGIDRLELNDYKCFDVIMKDLEVLEILKTKKVNLWLINELYNPYSHYSSTEEDEEKYILSVYNRYYTEDKNLSSEEFVKIMRWLKRC